MNDYGGFNDRVTKDLGTIAESKSVGHLFTLYITIHLLISISYNGL